MRKMMALSVIYENSYYHSRSLRTLNISQHPEFYKRQQTELELSCAKGQSRVFSKYTYFFKNFASVKELLDDIITGDDYLKTKPEEAETFRTLALASINEYYNTDLHFRKKKKGKVSNQILMEGI
jgi:hypothetical protein